MHTDGNAIAGVLREIFGVEVTAESRTCQSCTQTWAIGAHRLYTGAGYVLRCPNCGDMAATIVDQGGEYRVALMGAWSVQQPA
jgi:Zn finger protein HypA/HybF involved in hydrogenase expression